MTDIPGHSQPQPDDTNLHTLTIPEVETLLMTAGVVRSRRHVLRLCKEGALDAVKFPGGPSGPQWYVSPASVPKVIGDLRQIDAQRERRGAPQHGMSGHVAHENSTEQDFATPGHSQPRPATSTSENTGMVPPPSQDTPRHAPTETDIYNHPYVRLITERADRFEKKYDDLVLRNEERERQREGAMLELQRMIAVANSETLANFMLKAKDLILGSSPEKDKTDPAQTPAS